LLVIGSLVYWYLALCLVGLLGVVQGECFQDVACKTPQTHVLLGGVAMAIIAYPFALKAFLRYRSIGGQG